jgi:hypothetical protein
MAQLTSDASMGLLRHCVLKIDRISVLWSDEILKKFFDSSLHKKDSKARRATRRLG